MKKFSSAAGAGNKEQTKPAKTGFRIVVHESISRFPVSNTRITFSPGGRSVTTKQKGMCCIELNEGIYTYTVKAPGYPQLESNAEVKTGVIQILYIKLEKADIKTSAKSSTS